jgi:hypothetical protein
MAAALVDDKDLKRRGFELRCASGYAQALVQRQGE